MHTQEHVYSTTSTIFFLSSLGPSHDICSNGLHCSEMSHFFLQGFHHLSPYTTIFSWNLQNVEAKMDSAKNGY